VSASGFSGNGFGPFSQLSREQWLISQNSFLKQDIPLPSTNYNFMGDYQQQINAIQNAIN